MTVSRNKIVGVFVMIIVVAGAVIVWKATAEDETVQESQQLLARQVERMTLRDELTISGELRRTELSKINSPFDGRVSQLEVEDGDTVNAGDVLFGLDGRPAVAVNGDFSFYRQLDVGTDGPDVLQLERILLESGYDPGAVDRLYTEATRSALRQWQIAYGYGGATPEPEETIIVSLVEGNGYTIGEKDTTALIIGPSVPGSISEQPTLVATAGAGAMLIPLANDPAIPDISVAVADVTISEGDTISIILTADPAPAFDTQVEVTFDGTATGGDLDDVADPDIDVDYLNDPLEDLPLIWPAGDSTYVLSLETLADDLDEDDETWSITVDAEVGFGDGVNYELGPIKTTTVEILDTNPTKIPTLTISVDDEDSPIDEGAEAIFTVTSDIELDVGVDVRYVVTGSATDGDDYDEQEIEPTFTFEAGDTENTFTIATIADLDLERDETITVTLLPSDDPDHEYLLTTAVTATVTIEDIDEPELTIITRETTVPEGARIDVVIESDQTLQNDVSVDYQIEGSATMGADFNVLTGTITFPAGRSRVALTIKTIDDDVIFVPSDMIVADWPARIGTVFVDEGETVQLGQELLTLTEPNFTINLFANPTDRSELAVGQTVTVEIEAGDQESTGVITELDDAATISDTGSESYEGVVVADDELVAVDGANVRIEVVLDERVDALVVPIAAISQDATGNDIVRVADPATGASIEVSIETGLQEGSFTEVVAGLVGDELVVIIED